MLRNVGWGAGVASVALLACQVRGVIGSNETAANETATTGAVVGGSGTTRGISTVTTTGPRPETETSGEDGTSDGPSGPDSGVAPRFDVGALDVPELCAPPEHPPCDGDQWWAALGLGCSPDTMGEFTDNALAGASMVYRGPLGSGHYGPREGNHMVILSTGLASDVPLTAAEIAERDPSCDPLVCPSSELSPDRRYVLPQPVVPHDVSPVRDCIDDPSLVGTGDCSNSIAEHWARGDGAVDYSELRVRLEVPPNTDAFRYDFAFFSSEYPLFITHDNERYNDMYIAWLESESWTGNISFDDDQNPITVHSVFLDYRSQSDICPDCEAPALEGFSMEEHAGTKWLTTLAPVTPGEEIELIFAVLDLSDGQFDSFVLLDNFQWTCSDGPPITSVG